jgi:hypothetical protein
MQPIPTPAMPEQSAGAIPAWLIALAGAIVLAGVAVIFVILRKR